MQIYETTRGKHFFFKNSKVEKCTNHARLACGFRTDIKSGKKNSYAVRKKDGEERQVIYDIFEDEEYKKPRVYTREIR